MTSEYATKARNLRRWSTAMYVLAGLFALAGIVLLIITGNPTCLITIFSGGWMALSGYDLRETAGTYDRLARR